MLRYCGYFAATHFELRPDRNHRWCDYHQPGAHRTRPQAAAIGHAGEQVAGDRDRQQLEDDGEGQDEAGLIDSQVDSESE